jgi:hypothetical protein
MNRSPRYKLISLLPCSPKALIARTTLIETVCHQRRAYDLKIVDESLAGEPVKAYFSATYLDELIEHEDDCEPGEQIDLLAWHITPVHAEQFTWLRTDRWTRTINAPDVEEWFQAGKRYCLLVQAINKQGKTTNSKLSWLQESKDTEAFDQILDRANRLDERKAAMFAFTVYEPRLAAAFAVLRPHPAWKAPELGDGE